MCVSISDFQRFQTISVCPRISNVQQKPVGRMWRKQLVSVSFSKEPVSHQSLSLSLLLSHFLGASVSVSPVASTNRRWTSIHSHTDIFTCWLPRKLARAFMNECATIQNFYCQVIHIHSHLTTVLCENASHCNPAVCAFKSSVQVSNLPSSIHNVAAQNIFA